MEKNKNSIIVKLNSSLYDAESVKEAFEELKKETNSKLDEGEYFVISIKNSEEAETYGYEFLNYVLKLMKNKGIV